MPADLAGQNQRHRQQMQPGSRMNPNQNGGNPILASQLREFFSHEDQDSDEGPPNDGHRQQHQLQRQTSQQLQDHYANQIRNSQLQQRFQQQQQQQQQVGNNCASYSGQQMMQQQALRAGPSSRTPAGGQYTTSGSAMNQPSAIGSAAGQANGLRKERAQAGQRDVHVNFNRSNQANGDDDEGDSRKKKYLTAKYGQQQMNLIKKRLKIELWLYEHLQELAKGSGSEVSRLFSHLTEGIPWMRAGLWREVS